MKKSYQTPQIEVVEINLEGIICASPTGAYSPSISNFEDAGSAW